MLEDFFCGEKGTSDQWSREKATVSQRNKKCTQNIATLSFSFELKEAMLEHCFFSKLSNVQQVTLSNVQRVTLLFKAHCMHNLLSDILM